VLYFAECFLSGHSAKYIFTECPDKKHSAKSQTLGKVSVSSSDGSGKKQKPLLDNNSSFHHGSGKKNKSLCLITIRLSTKVVGKKTEIYSIMFRLSTMAVGKKQKPERQ
jgi:hypothetical protein